MVTLVSVISVNTDKWPLCDAVIETEEYGVIPISIDMDNVETHYTHMVQLAEYINNEVGIT